MPRGCQGLRTWTIVHTMYYNLQILNCELSIVNCQLFFLPRGVGRFCIRLQEHAKGGWLVFSDFVATFS